MENSREIHPPEENNEKDEKSEVVQKINFLNIGIALRVRSLFGNKAAQRLLRIKEANVELVERVWDYLSNAKPRTFSFTLSHEMTVLPAETVREIMETNLNNQPEKLRRLKQLITAHPKDGAVWVTEEIYNWWSKYELELDPHFVQYLNNIRSNPRTPRTQSNNINLGNITKTAQPVDLEQQLEPERQSWNLEQEARLLQREKDYQSLVQNEFESVEKVLEDLILNDQGEVIDSKTKEIIFHQGQFSEKHELLNIEINKKYWEKILQSNLNVIEVLHRIFEKFVKNNLQNSNSTQIRLKVPGNSHNPKDADMMLSLSAENNDFEEYLDVKKAILCEKDQLLWYNINFDSNAKYESFDKIFMHYESLLAGGKK